MKALSSFLSLLCCAAGATAGSGGPYLILHDYFDATGKDPPPSPSYIKNHEQYLSTTPFDGFVVAITDPTNTVKLSTQVMKNIPIDYDRLNEILSPLAAISYKNITQNFALVFIDRPADFFDDWTETIQNFGKIAAAARANNLKGVFFDNEQYLQKLGEWPRDVSYPEKGLDAYRVQARLRGKQIMQEMVRAYPDITVITVYGAWLSEFAAPAPLFPQWQYANQLIGPFVVGFTEGLGRLATGVDGGELYNLRSPDDFFDSYNWRKYTIASAQVNSPIIPISLRDDWADQTNVAFGICDLRFHGKGMDSDTARSTIANAIKQTDQYVWWYPERYTYLMPPEQGGAPNDWVEALRQGKAEGLARR